MHGTRCFLLLSLVDVNFCSWLVCPFIWQGGRVQLALSSLQSFRVLRILRVAQQWKSMNRLMDALQRTLVNLVYFTFVMKPADFATAEADYLEAWGRALGATLAELTGSPAIQSIVDYLTQRMLT